MKKLPVLLLGAWLCAAVPVRSADPAELARRIDARLAEGFDKDVRPAKAADDAEFLRRVTLDVIGRIPTVAEARSFLGDTAADRRVKLVERLLASPGYPLHTASVWRAALVPQASINLRVQYLGVSTEAWLIDRIRAGRRHDEIIRELLTTPLDYLDYTPEGLPRPVGGLSPVAFYQANDLKPETVASSVARLILGVRMECAQCHNHPFDKWTQKQFWETAAFFANVSPLDPKEKLKPFAELIARDRLEIPEKKEIVPARFLDGLAFEKSAGPDPRRAFAAWVTVRDNPFFAKATVNRVWSQLFGVGLVDPVDDFGPHNPPSHPELLDDLAAAFTAADFDLKFLIRALTRTDAYQRTSRADQPAQLDPRRFARMNVKGLTPEQLFDSLAQATGYRDPVPASARGAYGLAADSSRGQFMAKFAGGSQRTDSQTSILQALNLMNGAWLTRQTDPAQGELLKAVADAPFLDDAGKVETLFLAALARSPKPAERERFVGHLSRFGSDADRRRPLADVLYALVNSNEFLLNH
jgi:hypothetical protein